MSTVSIGNSAPAPLAGETLFLLASLATLGAVATNIVPPALPRIGAEQTSPTPELRLPLGGFFVPSTLGQIAGAVFRRWDNERAGP